MRLVPTILAAAAAIAVATPTLAHEVVYIGTFSGANEAPPNGSTGTGTAMLTIDDHLSTIHVQFSFSNLLGNVTAAHIHAPTAVAFAGTAGVATPTPTFTGMANGVNLGVKSGSYDHLFDMSLASSWNASYLNAAPRNGDTSIAFSSFITSIADGKAYLNIHTSVVGGGEVRTFFTLAPVPEPETYALMLAGLGLVGVVAKRRQKAA